MALAPGLTFADVPIAELPAAHRPALEVFGRRLTCALYYREVGRPLPLDHYIVTGWTPWADPASADFAEKARNLFPDVRLTNRRNTDIGNQFTYIWGLHPEGTLFGFTAQFSKSYFFLGCAIAPALFNEMKGGVPAWKQHRDDIAALSIPRN